jgi:hypothetical protein
MTYGLTFTNNSDVVTLDSEFSRLVIVHEGTYSGSVGSFPITFTSQEPPLIFVRPTAGAFVDTSLIGSPGNWTGWRTGVGSSSGSFFVAVYESTPTANYGLRLWDGNSKLLFDNGTPCAQFTNVITSWAHVSTTNPSVGRYEYRFSATVPLNTGNYMLINNMAMNIPGQDTFSRLSMSWVYASNTVSALLQNIGDFNSSSFFAPLMFGKKLL